MAINRAALLYDRLVNAPPMETYNSWDRLPDSIARFIPGMPPRPGVHINQQYYRGAVADPYDEKLGKIVVISYWRSFTLTEEHLPRAISRVDYTIGRSPYPDNPAASSDVHMLRDASTRCTDPRADYRALWSDPFDRLAFIADSLKAAKLSQCIPVQIPEILDVSATLANPFLHMPQSAEND